MIVDLWRPTCSLSAGCTCRSDYIDAGSARPIKKTTRAVDYTAGTPDQAGALTESVETDAAPWVLYHMNANHELMGYQIALHGVKVRRGRGV